MTDDVIRTADLRAAGVTGHQIDLRCRPGGPWQRILPGVLLLSAGPPTRAQRLRAALVYAGPGAVITGVHALREQGLSHLPEPDRVHVLQPEGRRLTGHDYVFLERTTRLPTAVVRDGLALAGAARAVLDAVRREPQPLRVHQLLGAVVRAGLCGLPALLAELNAGSKRGAAAPRSALRALTSRESNARAP
ncbi:hypothetical protein [Saccharothrix coeruleofusca]|uniref:Uncharacterized protein n=1 Tax=Saccharothrix coeruleofusca TaxID=33919 RepID=A0A918ED55_9PSEU|nr:hypothetical protein [Saccharothrix coeruleofusca]GGP45378.1 hypothetical protein GCM10010185_16450 [Saccharothrix coeruleofusca]